MDWRSLGERTLGRGTWWPARRQRGDVGGYSGNLVHGVVTCETSFFAPLHFFPPPFICACSIFLLPLLLVLRIRHSAFTPQYCRASRHPFPASASFVRAPRSHSQVPPIVLDSFSSWSACFWTVSERSVPAGCSCPNPPLLRGICVSFPNPFCPQ